MLVFKDATAKATVKVTDFGYSTLVRSTDGRVFLPKSRPWNAPEYRYGEFTVAEAKKTDIYSFGLLCLWVLFGSMRIQQNFAGCTFESSIGPRTSLEQLKDDDKVEHIANQLLESVPLAGLNAMHRIRLKEFFSLTVLRNPEKRTSKFARLVSLLSQKR